MVGLGAAPLGLVIAGRGRDESGPTLGRKRQQQGLAWTRDGSHRKAALRRLGPDDGAFVEGERDDVRVPAPAADDDPIPHHNEVKQIMVDEQAAPVDDAGRERLLQQAMIDVELRESIVQNLTEQVNVEFRAHEARRKEEMFTSRRDDTRSVAQRARDEAQWKADRLQELADTTMVDTEAVRAIPPSPDEIAAAETEKFRAREDRSNALHAQVAEIAKRGLQAAQDDRGSVMSDEKRAYREAVARAEAQAAFGDFAPEVQSGYGRVPATDGYEPQQKDMEAIDEFGGAFPGYESG